MRGRSTAGMSLKFWRLTVPLGRAGDGRVQAVGRILERGLELGGKFAGVFGLHVLVHRGVDVDDRAAAAIGDAFDELQGEVAVGRGLPALAVEGLLEVLHQRVGTAEGAGQRTADAHMAAANRRLAVHRVERHHFEDLHRGHANVLGDPGHVILRDVTAVFLHQVQEGHRRTALLRILRDDGGSLRERLRLERAGGGGGRRRFVHGFSGRIRP